MFQQGESQAEIARVLGVHRQTVHRWSKQVEQEGRAALKKAGRAGRKPRLSTANLQRIAQELKRGPEGRVFSPRTRRVRHGQTIQEIPRWIFTGRSDRTKRTN